MSQARTISTLMLCREHQLVTQTTDVDLIDNTTAFAKQTTEILLATTRKLQEIQEEEQKADDILHQVEEHCHCMQGWPV